jgi:hypothetical protein
MHMRQMSLQRKRVVVMATSIAALSGTGPLWLLRGHRYLGMGWLVFMAVMLVAVIVQMAKLKREEGC